MKTVVPGLALACSFLAGPLLAREPPTSGLQQDLQRYAAAWGSRDADRIVALHSEDSTFQLFVDGATPARGKVEIRAQFQKILTDNPQYSSSIRSIRLGGDFAVIEYDIAMQPPRPFTLGRYRYRPSGKAYSVPAVDVIQFENGLVTSKATYLDTGAARANSQSAESPAAVK
jgi:steroid delta-isomerase-like uncharacterized protein